MSGEFHCHAPGCGSGKGEKSRTWSGDFPFCPTHRRLLKDACAVAITFGVTTGAPSRITKIIPALEAAVPRGESWVQLVRCAQDWLKTKDADMGRQQELFHVDS